MPWGEAPLKQFQRTGKSVTLNKEQWTVTFLIADNSTPRFDIQWGKWRLRAVPIPPKVFSFLSYRKGKGDSDLSVCIYDKEYEKFYSFWHVNPDPQKLGSITVGAGSSFRVDGSGWWDNTKEPWTDSASGRSGCAGLVMPDELQRGEINHALAAGWPRTLFLNSTIYPAKTTDGKMTDRKKGLPAGARLRLDPSLSDEALSHMGLKQGDIVLAHAMQKYGVYLTDSSETFSITFASGHGQGDKLYPETTGTWPNEIMNYFHVIPPPDLLTTAPLENRFRMKEPGIVLP